MYGTVMFESESSVLIPLTLRIPCRAELLRRRSGLTKVCSSSAMLTKAKQPFVCPVGDQNYPRRTKVCDLVPLVGAIKSAIVNTSEWFAHWLFQQPALVSHVLK